MKTATLIEKRGANGFEALVAEAVTVERERRARDTVRAAKLTPQAFLREAVAVARTTPERIVRLRAELEGGKPGLDQTSAALRRMIVAVRSVNFPSPPRELRRLNHLLTADALAELGAVGSSSFELFALAVQIAGERHAEDFGTCEDSAAHAQRLVELALRRDDLFGRMTTEFTADDLLIGEADSRGMALVSFRLSGGAVPLGPRHNAGERLLNWMLTQGR